MGIGLSLQVGGSKLGKEECWELKYIGVQCKGGRYYAGPALPLPTSGPGGMLGGPGDGGQAAKVSPVAQKQLRAASACSFRQLVTSRLTTPH